MKTVEKGWGREVIFADTELYCGKLLCFETGKQFSMHFHDAKDESWLVLEGKFELTYIDTQTAKQHTKVLQEGDTWRNFPLEPHRLTCLEQGVIVEVSTADSDDDNYRILPGDSQKL